MKRRVRTFTLGLTRRAFTSASAGYSTVGDGNFKFCSDDSNGNVMGDVSLPGKNGGINL